MAPLEALGALYGGLLHPLLTPTHALGLVALGLLIGRQPAGKRRVPLLLFALALAGGLIALALAVGETPAATVLLAAVAVSGLLVAVSISLPLLLIGLLAVMVGAAIGLDSPPEVISLAEAAVMLLGIAIGATLELALMVACAARMGRDWQQLGVRCSVPGPPRARCWRSRCGLRVSETIRPRLVGRARRQRAPSRRRGTRSAARR